MNPNYHIKTDNYNNLNHFYNTDSMTNSDAPQYDNNLLPHSSHSSQLTIRPKSNPMMNLNNLDVQSHSSMDSYSSAAVMSTQQSCSYAPQYGNCDSRSINSDTNGLPHFVNSSNTTFDSSQPQLNHKFEIPGFEIQIIIRPISNPMMNLNNLDTQSHSSMDSYSSAAVMSTQQSHDTYQQDNNLSEQNYISGVDYENFFSGSYAVNTMNMQNIDNNQPFVIDSSQSQQQSPLLFNNLHGTMNLQNIDNNQPFVMDSNNLHD